MTETQKRERVLAIAKSQVGISEFPAGSNNVKYNTWFYGREVHDGDKGPGSSYAWCLTSVCWIFNEATIPFGNQGWTRGFASCPDAILRLKDKDPKKRWGVEIPLDQAKPGDILFIDFNLDGKWDHVEIIEGIVINKKAFTTFGGNTSDKGSQSNGGTYLPKERLWNPGMKVVRPNQYNS